VLDLTVNLLSDEEREEILVIVSKLTNLEKFYIRYDFIGYKEALFVQHLLSRTKTLHSFSLDFSSIQNNQLQTIVDQLSKTPTLNKVFIRGCELNAENAKIICQLNTNSNIVHLNFSHNKLLNSIQILGDELLQGSTHIRTLDLSNNSIHDASYIVTQGKGLVQLKLAENEIGTANLPPPLSLLSGALVEHQHLVTIDLSRNGIRHEVFYLSGPLKDNYITRLNLRGNRISTQGIEKMRQSLISSQSLRWLDLSENQLNGAGGIEIGTCLSLNSTLTHLNISRNELGVSGTFAIAKALSTKNSTMQSLVMETVDMGKQGADSLGDMLQRNNSLTSLSIASNSIGHALEKFFFSLASNTTLTVLNAGDNTLTKYSVESLSNALSYNCRIQEITIGKLPSYDHILTLNKGLTFNYSLKKIIPYIGRKIEGEIISDTEIFFYDRDLTCLGLEIDQMIKVSSISVVFNKLQSIPRFDPANLTKLILRKNELANLGAIIHFSNLVHLDLSHNLFEAIDPSISELVNLEHLNFGFNQIFALPFEITTCTALKVLKLRSNNLDFLPCQLYELKNLEELDLEENTLKAVLSDSLEPSRVWKNPELALLKQTLSERVKQHLVPYSRLKLMVMGPANVGLVLFFSF